MLNSTLKIILFLTIILSFSNTSFSQEDSYVSVAQVLPQPIGGMDAIYKHINYPSLAKKAGYNRKSICFSIYK